MKCSDIKNTRGGPNKIREMYYQKFGQKFRRSSLKNMPERVAAVTSAEGSCTRF
jgi:hypothetical protein